MEFVNFLNISPNISLIYLKSDICECEALFTNYTQPLHDLKKSKNRLKREANLRVSQVCLQRF